MNCIAKCKFQNGMTIIVKDDEAVTKGVKYSKVKDPARVLDDLGQLIDLIYKVAEASA